MKILVTGGAGFIGSHVCEALLKRGDSVICVDDFNEYYDPKRKEKNIEQALKNDSYLLYKGDICDIELIKKIFFENKIDKVIHIAARAGVRASMENPRLYGKTNVLGTVNLLEIAKDNEVKNFVFASSSSVYGANKKVPFSEEDRTENQISPYAVTKKSAELMCYAYHKTYGINISCLRFFTVYGPRGRPDMAPFKFTNLIDAGKELTMYGDGTSARDYTYVLDIVDGVIFALDKNYPFEIFNLGNSQAVELGYFISLVEKLLNKKANIVKKPRQAGDVLITYADISKAKKMLGYNPKTTVEQGMKKFIEWYKEELWIYQ